MQNKTKKVLSIVLNTLAWIFLIFAILVTIVTFATRNSKDGVPSAFGTSFVTIQSDSMKSNKPESFEKGDLLIVENIAYGDQAKELEEGDIIVFRSKTDINQNGVVGDDINTHRIIQKILDSDKVYFITQGDNRQMCPNPDDQISYTDVIAVWKGDKIANVGGIADFLSSSLGFLLVIVLPMALFFLYEVYNLIKIIMAHKVKKARAEGISAEQEEEIKRLAVEEYLKNQQNQTENLQNSEEKK